MDMNTIVGWLIGGFGTKAAVIGGAVLVAYEVAHEFTIKMAAVSAGFPPVG